MIPSLPLKVRQLDFFRSGGRPGGKVSSSWVWALFATHHTTHNRANYAVCKICYDIKDNDCTARVKITLIMKWRTAQREVQTSWKII